MSLLTVVQNACEEIGIDSPNAVIGNTNSQVVQLLALANREGKELASRYLWEALIKEQTFTLTTGQRSQGVMDGTIVSDSDFDYIINDTIWNRSLARPIFGPKSPGYRQALKAFPVTGPFEKFWIQGGTLYIDPSPSTADTAAFEYKSHWWCESSGGSGQAAWAADADVGRLEEDLMTLGLIWRWNKVKGLEYAEDFNTYERRVIDATARDGGKERMDLTGSARRTQPGIFVPEGNWNL